MSAERKMEAEKAGGTGTARQDGDGEREVIKLARSECAVLSLVLQGRWFDMIASGEKLEEYREASLYWKRRLENWDARVSGEIAPVVEFRLGYAADAPRVAFWCLGAETTGGMLGYGYTDEARHPEWGEPEGPHFVIFLGGRVELEEGRTAAALQDMDKGRKDMSAERKMEKEKERRMGIARAAVRGALLHFMQGWTREAFVGLARGLFDFETKEAVVEAATRGLVRAAKWEGLTEGEVLAAWDEEVETLRAFIKRGRDALALADEWDGGGE